MPKLNPTQKAFVIEYLKNGHNATRAYLKIRPNVTYDTAANNGSRMLGYSVVKAEIDKRQEKESISSLASREYLIKQAHDLGLKAENHEDIGNALKSVELKGKLNRVFTEDKDDGTNYQTLIQSLTINIDNKDQQNNMEVIDVDANDE